MNEQGTAEWHQDRLGRVTASKIADVMMKPATAGYQNYLAQLVCERLTGQPTEGFTSAAMAHGTETEPQARAYYEMETGRDVEQVGFIPHPTLAMSGASPDGIIGADGLIEIKAPNTATHLRTLLGGKIDRRYALQMQFQMACTGRQWCDFVSFDPRVPLEMQMHIERVDRDQELIAQIEAEVAAFLEEAQQMSDALISKFRREAA